MVPPEVPEQVRPRMVPPEVPEQVRPRMEQLEVPEQVRARVLARAQVQPVVELLVPVLLLQLEVLVPAPSLVGVLELVVAQFLARELGGQLQAAPVLERQRLILLNDLAAIAFQLSCPQYLPEFQAFQG